MNIAHQLIGLLLIGLGLQTPSLPAVLGDEDVKQKGVEARMAAQQFKEARNASKSANLEERKRLQENFKLEVKNLREKAKEEVKTQKEAFKVRLDKIKDEKKKNVVEKADVRLSDINTKRTQEMTEHLNKMDEVLTRISQKIADLNAQGKDTTKAEAALSEAQAKLSAAKSAVSAQAAKEYVIGVTSENKLGEDVKRAIEALKKDLLTVQEAIKGVRESITNAIKEIALLAGGK